MVIEMQKRVRQLGCASALFIAMSSCAHENAAIKSYSQEPVEFIICTDNNKDEPIRPNTLPCYSVVYIGGYNLLLCEARG